jgi:hypothetical protein
MRRLFAAWRDRRRFTGSGTWDKLCHEQRATNRGWRSMSGD